MIKIATKSTQSQAFIISTLCGTALNQDEPKIHRLHRKALHWTLNAQDAITATTECTTTTIMKCYI
jgi:hypothetical protein